MKLNSAQVQRTLDQFDQIVRDSAQEGLPGPSWACHAAPLPLGNVGGRVQKSEPVGP